MEARTQLKLYQLGRAAVGIGIGYLALVHAATYFTRQDLHVYWQAAIVPLLAAGYFGMVEEQRFKAKWTEEAPLACLLAAVGLVGFIGLSLWLSYEYRHGHGDRSLVPALQSRQFSILVFGLYAMLYCRYTVIINGIRSSNPPRPESEA